MNGYGRGVENPFPGEFGLKSFPGYTFRVNMDKSFDEWLVVQRLVENDTWLDFSRGTKAEIDGLIVKEIELMD